MQSEPVEIDHLSLKEMLDTLVIDISVPYLEKKTRVSSYKLTPVEELSDIMQELSQRERDLKALAGITNLLLENNKILQLKNESLGSKLQHKKEDILRLKEKLSILKKDTLKQERKKVENANEIIIQLTFSNEELRKELNGLRNWPDIHNEALNEYQAKIETIEETHVKQLNEVKTVNQNLQNKLKQERSVRTALYEKYIKLKEKARKSSEETKILAPKVDYLQKKLQKYTKLCIELEDSSEQLRESNDYYKSKIETLEKNFKTIETIYNKSEILSTRDDEDDPESPFSLRSELQEVFTEIKNQKEVFLKPTYKRKTPTEEFFFLTAQAIIVNHPYMESIFTVSIKDLYRKVLKEDIPFHQWHFWIEKELNSAYLQKLFLV